MDIYDLLKIKKNQSGELISRLNQIAGQNIFMKAKDALRKKE